MRLKSVTIKNYRIHKHVVIDLDNPLCLIGGTNETGKSTIAEAIHRGLFLKAKGNTEEHRIMKSNLHTDGPPEVEISFESAGLIYTLKKSFSGQNGTTLLSAPGMTPLRDKVAEDKLAELLKTSVSLSGKEYETKWQHLWSWQGKAMTDPVAFTSSIRADIIRGLQDTGAAAVMQSELDLRLAADFKAQTKAIYNTNGTPKSISDLALITNTLQDKEDLKEAALRQLQETAAAATALDKARPELNELELKLSECKEELLSLQQQKNVYEKLQYELNTQQNNADKATVSYTTIADDNDELNKLKIEKQEAETLLAPLHERISSLNSLLSDSKKALGEVQIKLDQCSSTQLKKSIRKDFLQSLRELKQAALSLQALENEITLITEKKSKLSVVKEELATLPAITKQVLRSMETLAGRIREVDSEIRNIAAGVKLVSARQQVLMNDLPFEKGAEMVITSDTEIRAGDAAILWIKPGGGTSLINKKEELRRYNQELSELYSGYGFTGFADAETSLLKRDELQQTITVKEAELNALNAESMEARFSSGNLLVQQKKAEALTKGDLAGISDGEKAMYAEDPDKYISQLEIEMAEDRQKMQDLLDEREKLGGRCTKTQQAITDSTAESAIQQRQIDGCKAKIDWLVQKNGDDLARASAIQQAKHLLDQELQALKAIRAQLNGINGDQLESDITRLVRVQDLLNEKREMTNASIIRLKEKLLSDGNEDPREVYDKAGNQYRSVKSRYDAVKIKAEAIRLLSETFDAEQQQLSQQFTAPLCERIAVYLGIIYGCPVRVTLIDNNTGFSGLTISRDGFVNSQALAFSELSGGTQEQVAAAIRLAMAEVLAAGHNGCLPLIFDDAFANSDPGRIRMLQSMLDHAANRQGLQIIVLSCTPSEYSWLGAKEHIIQ